MLIMSAVLIYVQSVATETLEQLATEYISFKKVSALDS